MGVAQFAVDRAAKAIQSAQDRQSILNGLAQLRDALRPGASITVNAGAVTAQLGETEFLLSKAPYEMDADLEAFLRLDQIRKA